ncbi:MAG TPA: MaoC family dehydratase [Gaiellaceae bacterium]|nr:MaoC family dehydratase [Gaiellaceae bacterium]
MNAGDEFGPSSWLEVTQERIDQFADATGDHQWIHVDPEKAAQGPFATTIAHGFLTLSLLVKFIDEVRPSSGEFRMGINYGVNRVRFPAPVPVGSKLRAHFKVLEVTDVEGGIQVVTEGTVEREGGEKPVCVAEMVSRHYR